MLLLHVIVIRIVIIIVLIISANMIVITIISANVIIIQIISTIMIVILIICPQCDRHSDHHHDRVPDRPRPQEVGRDRADDRGPKELRYKYRKLTYAHTSPFLFMIPGQTMQVLILTILILILILILLIILIPILVIARTIILMINGVLLLYPFTLTLCTL